MAEKPNLQSGQSLIETILATFMLTTALITGLSLAIYALSASATAQNSLIATNLAREGIEAIRMMRDSNWLAGDAAGGSFGLQSCAAFPLNGKYCYPLVFDGPTYDLNPGNDYASFSRGIFYNINTKLFEFATNYTLYLQSDGTYTPTPNGNSQFSRKLALAYITDGEYSIHYPALSVKSVVGWQGRNCPEMTDGDPENTTCKVIVEERLTNWKDYK
ncbi:MAG: hypothetical protein HY395_01630 [Candidatus Doudnabacteria bacterium]|nr:hypothetical protein [Candidatus Doudnabacteria bacterium]